MSRRTGRRVKRGLWHSTIAMLSVSAEKGGTEMNAYTVRCLCVSLLLINALYTRVGLLEGGLNSA